MHVFCFITQPGIIGPSTQQDSVFVFVLFRVLNKIEVVKLLAQGYKLKIIALPGIF